MSTSNKSRTNFSKGFRQRKVHINPIAARLEQVVSVLNEVLKFDRPSDVVLSFWFKQQQKMGKRDRHEVAESVFHILRNLRLYRHFISLTQGKANQLLAILGMRSVYSDHEILDLLEPQHQLWFNEVKAVLDKEEMMAYLPWQVKYSVPDTLMGLFETVPDTESLIQSLNCLAPLDIRINPIKTNRNEVLERLSSEGLVNMEKVEVTPYSPYGIRLWEKPALQSWDLFKSGMIEVQDESSQLLCELVAPKRSEVVIDFCAGAGGKSLLLGAMMRSTGRLYAFDVSEKRLNRAKPRFARAGLSNVLMGILQTENDTKVKRLSKKADRVLVDAPCSGLGTLRRNPDLKWRQTPQDIEELIQLQARILDSAARCVRPKGRLVYSTCSVLPCENEQQVEAFLKRHPEFVLKPMSESWRVLPKGLNMEDPYLKLRPDIHGTDGFFAAVMERKE